MSTSSTPPEAGAPRDRTVLMWLVLWFVAYFVSRVFLEGNTTLSDPARVAVAFLPTPLFALFLWSFIRGLRSADELERRIQLEALAVAFPLGLLLLTTLGLVQHAVTLSLEDWSYNHIFPIFVAFYLGGMVLARKRYA